MATRLEVIGKKFDKKVIAKAQLIVDELERDPMSPLHKKVKTIKLRATGYKSFAVNLKDRLLLKNGVWQLMSHEKYNVAKGR